MIKIENVEVSGFEAAIRGMRNPMNSWDKSDSYFSHFEDKSGMKYRKLDTETGATAPWMTLGENDLQLMKKLVKSGSDHSKFMRMITVTMDITAPLYWWKEFDTYKVGTVANSCSTMHKIHAKPFELDDFSHEHNLYIGKLLDVIDVLNISRTLYLQTKDNDYWYSMIQTLPSSYNQRRTVQITYEVLRNMNRPGRRKNHKLFEWRFFCEWVDTLPYYKEITGD